MRLRSLLLFLLLPMAGGLFAQDLITIRGQVSSSEADRAFYDLMIVNKRTRSGGFGKPDGSFLFAGPTGVGKTEVTRQLARILGVELLRFDMSEYMDRPRRSVRLRETGDRQK